MRTTRKSALSLLCIALVGCSVLFQKNDTVLIRNPEATEYKKGDFVDTAKNYWQYTALAANSYLLNWPTYKDKIIKANTNSINRDIKVRFSKSCRENTEELIPTPDWYAWPDFPPPKVLEKADTPKLFFSVWEHRTGQENDHVSEVAIVFRGTEADQLEDWLSNARWFIPKWLKNEDQYGITRDYVAKAFEAEVRNRIKQGRLPSNVTIIALGHSLGGGLAQQFAYALPQNPLDPIRVKRVIAFNSSPVTGWNGTANPPRDENAKGLEIDRIFEHGEVLAYIRLPINIFVPPNRRSSIVKDIRFNLKEIPSGIGNHVSRFFACRLAEIAGATNGVIHTENWNEPMLLDE
ncbi:hypothetical protein P3W55_31520 [Pseudomonas citronellolis]|uniref:Fungal lipase-type domain-containing protein n=1 Tax=Pseudomonas citronellolis TaxID=53408 RepID=A0AAW6PIL4_9PSED|nr:DUF6792 domain-containing protein [Pseudomonas citronellolis]MDF3846252.1 hypothetical protein [Pseudomonas citronellolis]